MEITLKNGVGTYAVGICGIADVEDVSNAESVVADEKYSNYSKKELFWSVYDQIILPSRKNISEGADHSLRLFNIERNDTSLILNFNMDDFDEASYEIENATEDGLDVVLDELFTAVKDSFPDDKEFSDALVRDKDQKVSVPEDSNYMDRLKTDVFYSSWEVE